MQRRGCTDTEILTHQELPSAMSTTAPMLMLNDMPRVTLRAAEGEETVLLICPPTHFSRLKSVNPRQQPEKVLQLLGNCSTSKHVGSCTLQYSLHTSKMFCFFMSFGI